MKTTVYLDVLLCVNFMMDGLMLLSVARIMTLPLKRRRLAAGALVGAVGSLVVLLPPMPIAGSVMIGLAEALLITAAAFLPLPWRRFGRAALLLFAVSFLYGGCMTALLSLGTPKNLMVKNGTVYIGISPLLLVLLTLLCYGGMRLLLRLTGKEARERLQCRVQIWTGGHMTEVSGFSDTGNTLHEPFSGECVIVVRQDLFQNNPDLQPLIQGKGIPAVRIRMIPYSSVGGSGVLPAFRPDRIVLVTADRSVRVSAYLALGSEKNFLHGCDAIVPAELLRKGS